MLWVDMISAAVSGVEHHVAARLRLRVLELQSGGLEHRRLLQTKHFRRRPAMRLQPHHQLRCSLGKEDTSARPVSLKTAQT